MARKDSRKMRCERARFLYDEYSQGTLPVGTLGRVEEHLAGCPACREFYDQSDAISALIRESSEIAHPGPQYFENLHARVLDALDRPEAENLPDPAEIINIPATQWRRPLWWMGGVAAAALLAVASLPAMMAHSVTHHGKGRKVAIQAAAPAPQPAAIQAAAPRPNNPVQVAAAPTVVPNQTWDKSARGGSSQAQAGIESYINMKFNDDERDEVSAAERKANEEAQATMTSIRQKAEENAMLSPEVYAQLQLIKTQIVDGKNDDLRRSLRELENLVDPRVSEQLRQHPLVKQVNKYIAAIEDQKAGRVDDALTKYGQIEFLDRNSPVAIKAALQKADLLYSEVANFAEAQKFYQRCLDAGDKSPLNSIEVQHVKIQLDRLDRYQANNWEALDLLHKVHQGKWSEVLGAMQSLTALPHTEGLLPEAAQTIVQRMDAPGASPRNEITMGLYNLLAKQADLQQNVDIRAWLELALGDVAFTQLQDIQQAAGHYSKAAASGKSDATIQARSKLDQMQDENLAGLVRNRK